MSGFDIRDLRRKQAEQYAKAKEQEENEKKKQEEIKKIEIEQKMLQEIAFKNDFEDFINHLDTILVDVHNCHNILEMDLYVESFKQQIEKNLKFIDTDYCHQEILQKVTELINCVSQNTNSKFDITIKDSNTEAANKITQNIKQIMNLCKLHENNINIELMDTSNDEEIAKKLAEENHIDDMEFHNFLPIHQRVMEDDLPELIDEHDVVPTNIPIIPTITHPEYYVGFDAIEDPELIQLAYFQNELMDD